MAKYCIYCGHEVDGKYCTNCGKPVENQQELETGNNNQDQEENQIPNQANYQPKIILNSEPQKQKKGCAGCLSLLLIFILLMGLGKCVGSNKSKNSEVIATQIYLDSKENKIEESSSITETAKTSQLTTLEETTIALSEQIETTDLFENIYVPYANREMPSTFVMVEEFAKESGYEVNIVEPTDEIVGSIKLFDENGDYVYFSSKEVDDIEVIWKVSFYRAITNSEVNMTDYSSGKSISYNAEYNTHIIGESYQKVNGVDEQREFLFN